MMKNLLCDCILPPPPPFVNCDLLLIFLYGCGGGWRLGNNPFRFNLIRPRHDCKIGGEKGQDLRCQNGI